MSISPILGFNTVADDKVNSWIGKLEEVTNAIIAQLDELESELCPILLPSTPAPANEAIKEKDLENRCVISESIRDKVLRLERTANRLHEIRTRIDI